MIDDFFVLKFLKFIFNFRINFLKPIKCKILIYDRQSYLFAEHLFKNKKYHIFDVRYESINIYILLKTLFKINFFYFKNFKDKYKKIYFRSVSPKIIYTAIDNNPSFYKLKYLYKEAIYVSDQNGMRDNIFYNNCLKYNKKNKLKPLICDYFFVFGSNYAQKIIKVIKTKIIISGNNLNNSFGIEKKNKPKKKILFVSSGVSKIRVKLDKRIFNYLLKFCKNNDFLLAYKLRPGRELDKFYLKKKLEHDYKIIINETRKDTYSSLNDFSIVVFGHSTLGFEALARGVKCVCFGMHYFEKAHNMYKKKGPFWSNLNSYTDLKNLLLKVNKYSQKEWDKIYKDYSYQLLYHDNLNYKKKLKLNINKI